MAAGVPAPRPVRTAADFVGELRQLKAWTGLSYRDLDRRARSRGRDLAPSTVATALSRASLPHPNLVAAFVAACGGTESDVARWIDARRAVALAESAAPGGEPVARVAGAWLLPPDAPHFVGRGEEIERAIRLITASPGQAVLVTGPAGVGKTTFAIRLGHAVAGSFPDGQLYVDLRGFDPGGSTVSPDEAVRVFLDALGVPPDRVPATLPAQVGLYRSLLAGKRLLVILDNARDAAQVAPLLPGAAGCGALVTSRNQMTGLVVASAAEPIVLDLLPAADARDLLGRRLGAPRLRAEPEATDQIVAACAGLPLALAIVAARAAAHPTFRLRDLARELREARGGLDPFAGGDASADVRAVLSWSYRLLTPEIAGTFRLLSAHSGPDMTAAAAASLLGLPLDAVGPRLAALTRAHLLAERAPGRYGMHDLLRGYAAELAAADPPQPRREATQRVLEHYLHTACAADRLIDPDPVVPATVPDPPLPGTRPEPLAGRDEALTWLTAERGVLLASCHWAIHSGLDRHGWQLAAAIASYLDDVGHWAELIATQRAALAAAVRLGDRAAEAAAYHRLASGHARRGDSEQARQYYERALDLYGELGDHLGQAGVHRGLGGLCHRQDDHDGAFEHNQRALTLYEKLEHRGGQAMTLNNAGWLRAIRGEPHRALLDCRRALKLLQQTGDRHAEAATWDSLGYIHGRLGQVEKAAACYQRAIGLYRHLGDRYNEADTLGNLADLHDGVGDRANAQRAWRRALAILEGLEHPDADQVRARLGGAPGGAGIDAGGTGTGDAPLVEDPFQDGGPG